MTLSIHPLASNTLLSQAPAVLNIGIDGFNESISQHGGKVEHLPWRPPGNADPLQAWNLARLMGDARISAANAEACKRIIQSRPMWEDIAMRADGVWPEMKGTRLLLHAGPPVAWDAMCGPMHGAMVGAVLYEGWAKTPEQAQKMLARGDIEFAQCHDFCAVGPMTGIISASMPLIQVRDATHGNVAYTNINEGIGRCLRFGANGPDVLQKLKWFEDVLPRYSKPPFVTTLTRPAVLTSKPSSRKRGSWVVKYTAAMPHRQPCFLWPWRCPWRQNTRACRKTKFTRAWTLWPKPRSFS